MLQTWLFLFMLGHVAIPAARIERIDTSSDQTDNRPCQDREVRNRTVLGGLLLKSGVLSEDALKDQKLPNVTFLEFNFVNPVLIRGWTVKGRDGGMFGPLSNRRGYVASYVVTFVDKTGEVTIIDDPETHDEEFVSDGNLARPQQLSDVDLTEGVMTKTLRMAPIVWSGIPYMAVKLFYCARDQDITAEQSQMDGKEDEDEEIPVKELALELKDTRTTGTFAAAVDATKAAMGIKPKMTEDATSADANKTPYLPYTPCINPPTWRYAAKPTPVDEFSARGNPQQAWRAILGVSYTPYLFPTAGSGSHEHRLLEILFRKRSHVTGVKMGGLGEKGEDNGRWGVVTKFSLLYKNPRTGSWVYYSDSTGTPRVFTEGNRTRETAHKVAVFSLPVAINTDALGIFPHEWINKPYLSIDLLACYTQRSEEKSGKNATEVNPKASTVKKLSLKKTKKLRRRRKKGSKRSNPRRKRKKK